MKIVISILGSTGSIGTTTLKIIKKKRASFLINTLSANSNYNIICSQIKEFNPKNFVIKNVTIFKKVKAKFKNKRVKILNDYNKLNNYKKKNDITVSAVPGIAGLEPTLKFIKSSKKMLLANKESIICGWNLIKSLSRKNKTILVPIDSEHFSIKKILDKHNYKDIKKIYITASGGPFLNLPIKYFKNIKPINAIRHPKWKMGKKISVDSATLMNKILELIEAHKLFNFDYNKYKIIIHPQSLVHAIVKLKNGLTEFLYHEPDMIIPIANAIFDSKVDIDNFYKTNKINEEINKLEFYPVNAKRFPVIKLIPKMNKFISTPIIINAANEILIDNFLKRKISFNSISNYLFAVLRDKDYKKYAIQKPNNLKSIYKIDSWSRKTTLNLIT
jgi:1-deoxy-D-xylulose-5-phosphate reductoisomerase